MRLKRLICRGFKSFADRTEFEFDSSLTGIVGPNGCGKSNVVDALKWVLGDQRARSLRGEEMLDVIFKGAQGRDAMPMAEVEIQLEDENGILDGRTEVTIGRRLNREKESEYLLNGESVRLKDIRAAMLDTGLGVGAYSVLEQGRIDAVLSANPESRRLIFEEAAGISRFKAQKRESLRKLDRTEQNLARVQDLLEERGRRIRSLKIQASRAKRYAELRDRLRDLKAALAVTEAGSLREADQEKRGVLEQREEARRSSEQELGELREAVNTLEEQIRSGSAELEEHQQRLHQVQGQLEAAMARAESLGERGAERLAEAESSRARQSSLQEQLEERRQLVDETRGKLSGLQEREAALAAELAERRSLVQERQREADAVDGAREQARARTLECIRRRTEARNRAHDHEAQLRSVQAREERLDERAATIRGDLSRLSDEHDGHLRQRDELAEQVRQLQADEERLRTEFAAAESRAAELEKREGGLREQLSSALGRAQILADLESQMEGVDHGPRHLLERSPEGLRGRLLDLLDVDLEYGPALEAALGPLVQALVVDTRAHAEAMLAKLALGKHGRAILLVEEEFAGATDVGPAEALPTTGAPLLADHVRCSDQVRPLLRWLLRDVRVVVSASDADPSQRDTCFVTQAGELIAGPRVEGGDGEGHGGLVVRRALSQRLEEERAALQTQLDRVGEEKREAVSAADEIAAQARATNAKLQERRSDEQRLLSDMRRVDDRRADLERERETLELERAELVGLSTTARTELGRHLFQVHLLERLEFRETQAEQRSAEEHAAARARVAEAREAEQAAQLEQVACATDREALDGTIRAHEQNLQDLTRLIEELTERETAARAGAERAQAEAAQCVEESQKSQKLVAELEEARAERAASLAALEEERTGARSRLAELEQRRAELAEEISALKLELSELEHRFARVEDRLREETAVELRRCLGEIEGWGMVARVMPGPLPPPDLVPVLQGPALPPSVVRAQVSLNRLWEAEDFDAGEVGREAQVVQSKVDRLGHVNLEAVRELEELESSYEFLENEVVDLKESRRSLMETLRRLETESRALFETTFEQARVNFHSIFRKLFQGGKADMYLTEGEDSLDAGIAIIARPPGKELQSINLLSGGERSLTALAILFALFKVKPSPFCVLDEVDAALDDTNVERFLRVLRDFVGGTQFCVVTHHKRTMAECQKLYGITMQHRGVSSRISVSLDEVDSITGEEPGTGPGRLVERSTEEAPPADAPTEVNRIAKASEAAEAAESGAMG